MPDKAIVNPGGAFGQTAGSQGAYAAAAPMKNGSTTVTINAGDIVTFTATTTADPIPVVLQGAAGDALYMQAGVAKDTIPPGKTGSIIVQGYAYANCTGTTPATNGLFLGGGAAGAMVLLAAPAAGSIIGSCIGVTLGTKTGNLAPVWVDRV